MAISINIRSPEGVNLNLDTSSYLATLPAMFDSSKNLGYFKDALQDSPQYGVAEMKEDNTNSYTGGATLIAGGSLSYSLQTHVVEGKLNSLQLGEGLGGVTNGVYLTRDTMTVRDPFVSFSKLGLDSDKGDDVSDILYGMMTGGEAHFLKLLSQSAVKFNGGGGDDGYKGGSKADVLNGMGGDDTLRGGGGGDKLTGGAGTDTLTGNGGKDQFIFKSVADSTASDFDTITDFNGGAGDRIHLKAIDADTTKSGNQAFDFIGKDDFSKSAGELRFDKSAGGTDVYGDTNGDGKADFTIHFDHAIAFKAGFFEL